MGWYPEVMSEDATLDAVLAGRSLARFSDGEMKLATGRSIKAQIWNPKIGAIMREVAAGGQHCISGIPNLRGEPIPKERARYVEFCHHPMWRKMYSKGITYGSAFVSRPDCAPHIDRPDYWEKVRQLWAGKDVVLVYGSKGKGLIPTQMTAASSLHVVQAPRLQAWKEFQSLYDLLKDEKRPVLMSLGATATALCWELSKLGVYAMDMGATGRFMRRSRNSFAYDDSPDEDEED